MTPEANQSRPVHPPSLVLGTRLALLANGFEPVPVDGKRAVAPGWTTGAITEARVRAELADHPGACSTGLRTGHLVGIDIDVTDPAEVEAIVACVETELGPSPFRRVGARGMMICYWNNAPIGKIVAKSADGTKIEILGQGQQFVAYGDHPDTGLPYCWPNAAEGYEPAQAGSWEIPVVMPAQLRDLAAKLAARLTEFGHPGAAVTGDTANRPANDDCVLSGRALAPIEIEARLITLNPAMDRAEWIRVAGALHATPCTEPDYDKRSLFTRWSRGGGGMYTSDEACEFAYDTMPPRAGGVGAGTFIFLTDQAGYGRQPVQSSAEVFGPAVARLLAANDQPTAFGYPPPKSAAELAAGNFPRAEYAVEKLIVGGIVNLLYGDGGTGKTLLALHFAVALAAGLPIFGLTTRQTPVLVMLAEDDDGETKARLAAICGMLGVNLAELPLETWCLPGWDVNLAHVRDDGQWTPGALWEPLRAHLARIGPCFLVLDTVSDIATLDETKRQPVNTLCKGVLASLCREFGATVLVNAHPSKAAMRDGTEYAGSTAWNNAVRNRLTFKRPEGQTKGNRRVLAVCKANYGDDEHAIELCRVGLTFMAPSAAGQSEADEIEAVLSVTLDLIDRGVQVVRANGAGQKPADVAKEVAARLGLVIGKREVLAHLNALERQGRLGYIKGGNDRRGQRAGFCRPEGVASSVASASQARS